jgi:hypothetical protein
MATEDKIAYVTMGFEGDLYVGPAGCTSPTDPQMMLAGSIKDPKYSYGYSEVDATLRKHRGNKAYQKGLLDVSVSFTLLNLYDDDGKRPADVALFLAALRSRRKPLTIIMLDKEGGEGIIGDFEVLSGDKSEGSEDAQAWDIECKPSVASSRKVDWYESSTTP